MNLTQINDCYCKLKTQVTNLASSLLALDNKVKAQTRLVYRYTPPAELGWNRRLWNEDAGPHLDPLEWTGNPDANGFPLPTNAAPTVTNVAIGVNDVSNGGFAARYAIFDGYANLPDDVTHIRDNNANTGELGMVLEAKCCNGILQERAGGNHTVSTGAVDRTLMDAVPATGGFSHFYSPQSDSGTAQGVDIEYSVSGVDGPWINATVQPDKPVVECMEIPVCDVIPEGWQEKPLDECCEPIWISSGSDLDADAINALVVHPDPPTIEELCPLPMTRAQLLALRNASALETGCHYLITDYNRACVGEATILLHATSANILSRNVHVQTTHDNEAWRGEYDISAARIVSLEDNLGNRVYGRTGAEVDRWDWGNTLLTENFVDNADVTLTKDSTLLTLRNNRFENDSAIDLRGVAGTIQNSSYEDDSIFDIENATGVNVLGFTMEARARLYGENSTNFRAYYSEMNSDAYWIFRGMDDARIQNSTFDSNARVYYTGGTRQWFYYTSISGQGTVRQASGIMQVYYTNIDSYGEIRNEAGSALWLIYGGNYSSRAYVRNFNTNEVRHYYTNVDSRAEIRHDDAARHIVYYSSVSDYSWLYMSGTVTVAYTQNLDSQARVKLTGGTHYRNRFSNLSDTTISLNTRSIYVHGRLIQTLTAANTNRGADYFNNSLI